MYLPHFKPQIRTKREVVFNFNMGLEPQQLNDTRTITNIRYYSKRCVVC